MIDRMPRLKTRIAALILVAAPSASLLAKHPLPGPHTFECEVGLPGVVHLSWDMLGIGDGSTHKAVIFRDGVLVVELASDALGHVDVDAPPGPSTYRLDILATGAIEPIASESCSVEVPGLVCVFLGGIAIPPRVDLTWARAPQGAIELVVLRDGSSYATLDPTRTSFTDEFPQGTHEYKVVAVIDDPEAGGLRQMVLGTCTVTFEPPVIGGFQRGDCTGDGAQNISDAICILDFLFSGGDTGCLEAADSDDGGGVDLTDAIFLLNHLFSGGEAPPAPFPRCGHDPTADELTCNVHSPCFTPPPP